MHMHVLHCARHFILPQDTMNHVHCYLTHNSQKLETTYMSFDRRMDKQNVVIQQFKKKQ